MGEQILVNHCLVSKIVMASFLFCFVMWIVYQVTFTEPVKVYKLKN